LSSEPTSITDSTPSGEESSPKIAAVYFGCDRWPLIRRRLEATLVVAQNGENTQAEDEDYNKKLRELDAFKQFRFSMAK
jgi:hypothetical protein